MENVKGKKAVKIEEAEEDDVVPHEHEPVRSQD